MGHLLVGAGDEASSGSIQITSFAVRFWLRWGVLALSSAVGIVFAFAAVSLIGLLEGESGDTDDGYEDSYESDDTSADAAPEEEAEEEAAPEAEPEAEEEAEEVLPADDGTAEEEEAP